MQFAADNQTMTRHTTSRRLKLFYTRPPTKNWIYASVPNLSRKILFVGFRTEDGYTYLRSISC